MKYQFSNLTAVLLDAMGRIEKQEHYFRHFDSKTKEEIRDLCSTKGDEWCLEDMMNDGQVINCPWLGIEDDAGNYVYVGDIVCINALRCDYSSMNQLKAKNVNHGPVKVYAFVSDIRGTLCYDWDCLKKHERPQGKERTRQVMAIDENIFDLHWSNGKFTVEGHIYKNPDLLIKWRHDA